MTLFAGIDLGTGGARCVVIDDEGTIVARASRGWSYTADDAGFPTFDTDAAAVAVSEACSEAMAACPRSELASVGVTSQRSGVVLIDEEGTELFASPNADGRAAQEGIALERAHGDEIYRIAGRLPAMLYLPARLAWFRAHRPSDAARVTTALTFGDWLVWKLTGATKTDRTQAAEFMLWDVARGEWSDALLERMGVARAMLPEIVDAGERAGQTTAHEYGFPPGLTVVPAGADTQCAALALGVTEPGQTLVVAGTTMLCERVLATCTPDPGHALWTSPHVVSDRFVAESHCGEAGAAVTWFSGLLGQDPEMVAARASRAEPGSGGVQFFDAYPSNASDFALVRSGGLRFPVPVLALGRSADDIARAVLEGIAFGARAGLDELERAHGPGSSLAVAGGVARSDVFAEALAGAAGTDITAGDGTASARGAAIMAAAEHFGGVREAAAALRDRGRRIAPASNNSYPALYDAWRAHAAAIDDQALRISHFMT